jgi:murein hydrolase activator
LLLNGLPSQAIAQSSEEQARAELKALQGNIARINREISSARARRNSLEQQLQQSEVKLGALQRAMADNRRAIAAAQTELEQLEQQRSELQSQRSAQQEKVLAELRGAWELGNEAQLKVLLSQQNPHTLSRVMAYYRYFFTARNEMLEQYRQLLLQLEQLQGDIQRKKTEQQEHQATLLQQQQNLVTARANRKQAVASLSEDIQRKGGQLQQLEKDRAKLEELLKAIEEAVINLQVPDNYQPFAGAKGKMPWPVEGKRSNRFGTWRNEGKMRWQGVMIPAPEGQIVKAIHHGRVVFSDWFRGSGLLTIIDHGDGYMSLYAHNESLLREVGEWVTAGTAISTVGTSGGRETPALYFEIRHQGKPTDPARWCGN